MALWLIKKGEKMKKLALIQAIIVAVFILFVITTAPLCAAEVAVDQYVSVTTSNENSTLDRITRVLTSTADITITNISAQTIFFPFHVVVNIQGAPYDEIQMPDALGGYNIGPYGKYYYEWQDYEISQMPGQFGKTDCSGDCVLDLDKDGDVDGLDLALCSRGGKLPPGQSLSFTIRFQRPASTTFSYNLSCFGILTPQNTPPTADAGQNATYTLSQGQDHMEISLDGTGSADPDGTISQWLWTGNPDPEDVEQPSLDLTPGTYVFTLVVVDDMGAQSVPDQVTIIVQPYGAQEVHPPSLSVESSSYTVDEGQSLIFHLTAIDQDGDTVVISATPKLENASFLATPGITATGTFTFDPDFSQQGIYQVVFTARDPAGNSDEKTVQITVRNVNRPPEFSFQDSWEMTEGQALTVPVKVQDPDGDTLRISAGGLPENAIFVEPTRTLTFTPNYDQAGTYNITFTATDGKDTVSAPLHIVVADVAGGGGSGLELQVDPVQSPTLLKAQRITGRVNAGGTPPNAISSTLITSIDPSTGKQGETLDVTIIGASEGSFATHFSAEDSDINFGSGIKVNSFEVQGPNEATVSITISPDAELGSRSVSITSGSEYSVSVIAFNVVQGTSSISGILIDPETGQPIPNAVITIQGTGISTTTGADGSFILPNVPPGEHTLIITSQNHEDLTIPINPIVGSSINMGTLKAKPTVFDPTAPPSVSVMSVVGRGTGEVVGGGDIEELKQLITDTILLVGGGEAGILDDYGNQLNPEVHGDGLVSLTPTGIRLIAQKMQRGGETVALGDLLFAFSFGLQWSQGSPMSLAEWLQTLQEQVNAAWGDPTNPDNTMAIVMFNRGKTISFAPPTLSSETRLNPLQAFLFTSSLWAYIHSRNTQQVGALEAPLGTYARIRRFLSNSLQHLGNVLAPPAYADDGDSTIQNRRYTRFWRNAFQYKADFLTTRIQPAYMEVLIEMSILSIPAPDIMALQQSFGSKWPVVGTAIDTLSAAVKLTYSLAQMPAPPSAESMVATVVTGDNGKKQVDISFKISPTQKRGNFSTSDKQHDYTYIYNLYRGAGGKQGQLELVSQLVVTSDTLVQVDNPFSTEPDIVPISWVADSRDKYAGRWDEIRFTMTDPNPIPVSIDSLGNAVEAPYATWFYTITLAKVAGLSDLLSKDALVATRPWWGVVMSGLSALGPLAYYSKHILVSDYSAPVLVTINSSGEVKLNAIEVDPNKGDVYFSDPYGSEDFGGERDPAFYKIPDGSTGIGQLFVKSGFKKIPDQPGHTGLAIDSQGNLYTVNTASEAQYGGRIFRFANLDGSRDFVGSINYYSRMLSFAHPTLAGPIAIGQSSLPGTGPEDLFVVDELAQELKEVPVSATYDPYRRVGQLWADIPFNAHGIDLEFDSKGDAVLLVQRVPSANLAASLMVSNRKVAMGETFTLTLRVQNPSPQTIQSVSPIIRSNQGGEKLTLVKQPTNYDVTLEPGDSTDFVYEYQALSSGVVNIQGIGQGSDPSGVTISSPLCPPSGLDVIIGSPIVIDSITIEPKRVGVGESTDVTMSLHNEGANTYNDVTPHLDITEPLGGTTQPGDVDKTSGPTPQSVSLPPGESRAFEYTFKGTSFGKVAFRGFASGVNSATGNTDTSVPMLSDSLLISPLSITLSADPESVKKEEGESTTVTLTVENTGNEPVYEVVPSLTWTHTDGEFEIWEEPDVTPLTLSGGESKSYTYTLRKPKTPGAVGLEGTVVAKTDTGAIIPVDPVSITVIIGPAITGHIYDVRMNGAIGIKDYIDGKDLDKPMKLWVDDNRPLKKAATIKAIPFVSGVLDPSQAVESQINPADGSYSLAVPGAGTYEIRIEAIEGSNVGLKAVVHNIGNESVERDYRVPHSLVLQTQDIINAYKDIKVPIGGLENVFAANMISVRYAKLTPLLEEYLKIFQKGVDSPPYEKLWEGMDDDREVTHPSVNWDALIRLDASLLFTLRRLSEASSIVVETIQDILPLIFLSKAINDFYDKYKMKPEEFERFTGYQSDPPSWLKPLGKLTNLSLKAFVNYRSAASHPDSEFDEKALTSTNEILGWIGQIVEQSYAFEGFGGDELLKTATIMLVVGTPTKFYLDQLFINRYTQPVLIDALNRAKILDLAGSTKGVLKDLQDLDAYIIKEVQSKMKTLNTVKTAQGAFDDFSGAMETINDYAQTLEDVSQGPYDPKKLAKSIGEGASILKKVSAAIMAIKAAEVLTTLMTGKPGQVCVGVDQAFSSDPIMMKTIPATFVTCTPGRRVR